MKKLKIISKYSRFILLIIVLYSIIFTNAFSFKSKYNGNEKEIEGYVKEIKNNSYIIKGKEKVLVKYKDKIKLNYNDYVVVNGIMKKPNNNTVFNTFNYKKYLNSKKIFYIMQANNIKIKKKNNNIFYILKNRIQNRIIHLLSISGTYISLIILFLKKLKIKNMVIIIFLLFYIVFTNFQISIIRSSICYILLIINKKYNLELDSKEIIVLFASFLLLINPFYIQDIGFLLSFVISYSLIYFNYLYKDKNYIYKLFIISTISFLVSLPIIINTNYSINFLSIIFNIILVPLASFVLFPISIITLIFPIFDNIFLFIINLFENISFFLNNIKIFTFSFSRIPIVLIAIYYLLLFNKKNSFVLLIIVFYFYNYYLFLPRIYFIDVGQGDSAIIRYKNKNILIDTGGSYTYDYSDNYILMFKSIGIKKIDFMFITHGDYDHMGDAINLVENFKVEKVIFNCGPYNDLEKELIKVLDKKKMKYYSCIKELNIDKNKLYLLQTKEYDNENDNSNVIYTELNGYKFMFMGDASSKTEHEILNEYDLPIIDVLKVGHHGSKTSSGKEFINEINPKYSVISVGRNNRYGHPNKEVLDNLKNSKIYRTDQDGSIMFKIKNNKLQIETCSP